MRPFFLVGFLVKDSFLCRRYEETGMRNLFALCLLCLFAAAGQAQSGFSIVEYCPAPGQFIDYTQYVENGDDGNALTGEDVCAKLNEWFSEFPNAYILSLGAFGGWVTVRMARPIPNREGADFRVLGNAFYEPSYAPSVSDTPGGSAEPAIVYVSQDVNRNGIADDPWYELAGSEYGSDSEIRNYRITYYEPDSMSGDVFWKDNRGESGYVERNVFHSQPTYFPIWLGKDSLVYRGTRLKDNAELRTFSGGSQKWVLFSFPWGYADNHPNSSTLSGFDIDWAVDSAGSPVKLSQVDFIRVQTSVNQCLDRGVGETSTEFAGIEVFHAEDAAVEPGAPGLGKWSMGPNPCRNVLKVRNRTDRPLHFRMRGFSGSVWREFSVAGFSEMEVDVDGLPSGLYFVDDTEGGIRKLIRL